jgi:hypothetical protein
MIYNLYAPFNIGRFRLDRVYTVNSTSDFGLCNALISRELALISNYECIA